WTSPCRGLDVAVPPSIDRTALRARDPPRVYFPHEGLQPPPKLKSPAARVPPELKYSEFKLIRKQLNALKNKCVKQEKKKSYSTFEVLSSHAWRCLAKARDLPDDQLSTLYIA
ncbi:hypothetical protein M569_11147, partial [Genlisea aurea]